MISSSLIQGCSTIKIAKAYQKLLERGKVDRPSAPHSFESGDDLGLLHDPAGQCCVKWWQPERAVLEYLDKLSARTKEEHRAELRVKAGADDQLIAIKLDHRLNGHSLEMFGTGSLTHRGLDGTIGMANSLIVGQIKLHAANVGLVGDRLGMKLEHDRKSDALSGGNGFVLGRGDASFNGRDAVGGQDLL